MKKNRKLPDFKEIYSSPFEKQCDVYFFSSNGVMSFNILTNNKELILQIEQCLNSKIPIKVSDNVEKDEIIIKIDGNPVLLARGWGHLTGVGALNLSEEVAKKVQDDFICWTISKLKGEI